MSDISYINWLSMPDFALAQNLGTFVKHHRLLQNKTQEQIAQEANISRSTLSLMEKGETVTMASFLAVLRVLNLLHVMDAFKVENQISPLELAKLEQKKKKKASKQPITITQKSTW